MEPQIDNVDNIIISRERIKKRCIQCKKMVTIHPLQKKVICFKCDTKTEIKIHF